jgi:hypothetical protein
VLCLALFLKCCVEGSSYPCQSSTSPVKIAELRIDEWFCDMCLSCPLRAATPRAFQNVSSTGPPSGDEFNELQPLRTIDHIACCIIVGEVGTRPDCSLPSTCSRHSIFARHVLRCTCNATKLAVPSLDEIKSQDLADIRQDHAPYPMDACEHDRSLCQQTQARSSGPRQSVCRTVQGAYRSNSNIPLSTVSIASHSPPRQLWYGMRCSPLLSRTGTPTSIEGLHRITGV